MLIWCLQFGVGEIISGLKFRGPKSAICGLKFGLVLRFISELDS